MKIGLIIVLGILALLVIYVISVYNKLVNSYIEHTLYPLSSLHISSPVIL